MGGHIRRHMQNHNTVLLKKTLMVAITAILSACSSEVKCQNNGSNGIDEQLYVALGGTKQYVEIMGSAKQNPVVLFLHGGPGWPQTPQLRYFNADLKSSVTIVAWEQSGCGKSLMANPETQNVSLKQLVSDGHELTQWLKKEFNTDKIYLAGFSWGSIISLHLADQYPDDYAAYISISQVVDIKRSITLSREWIKQQATLLCDQDMLEKVALLEKGDTSFCRNDLECFLKKYEMLSVYHGAMHNASIEAAVEKSQTFYPDYKDYDWMGGFMFSAQKLSNDLFETDLTNITKLKLPVYFFLGRHDWSLPTRVTEDYFEQLSAPKKELVWFENSGHEPLVEEANRFNEELAVRVTGRKSSK
jgi:pimeloyl-ACP methyl ester carboxylesterase